MHLTSMVKKKWTEKWKYSEPIAFSCSALRFATVGAILCRSNSRRAERFDRQPGPGGSRLWESVDSSSRRFTLQEPVPVDPSYMGNWDGAPDLGSPGVASLNSSSIVDPTC